MKREINFRVGKGRRTEMKKAFSPEAFIAACRFVGMTDAQIKAALQKQAREKSEAKT